MTTLFLSEPVRPPLSVQSSTPDTTRDLTLVIEVLTLPEGGFWDRSFFGEGEVKFDVRLVDRATGQTIGAGVVDGKASRGVLWSSASGLSGTCVAVGDGAA